MARAIGDHTTKLSWAEQTVVQFLHTNKGREYTVQEIETETGIRADFVNPIMDNLRWKGYDVGSRGGKHFFIHNSIWSYIVGGSVFAAIFLIMGTCLFFGL